MPSPKPITIVGGGLAGLTLGIGLRRSGVPVTIWEAGRYPRHRVCGEFISGNGQAVLERLGLRSLFLAAGAFQAQTAMFVSGRNRSPIHRLPAPALCLSRYTMDALLARAFQELGGELRDNTRWTSIEPGEGVVRAAGRRAKPSESGWRWFGVKAHVSRSSQVNLAADLEMHISSAGYVGVNRINDGEVNVCGLFRARHGDPQPDSKRQWLRGKPGSLLYERLDVAQLDEHSFCSVAGLSLKPERAVTKKECCIGDALTMTPPVTGNGMSMAFESSEIAIEPLTAYSHGGKSWTEAQQSVARACDEAFRRRLAWARFLQWLMFSPVLAGGAGSIPLRSEWLWRLMFDKTR
jgi:2-polyprenyl-6-methoxyphenol hydroxylase-like FAD-dependent oxidoreductase